jgi:hypothetical protein
MTAHVALRTRMISGTKNLFEHLGPLLHWLAIHSHHDMFNDRRPDPFVSESKLNRSVAAIEFQDGPDRRAHLLSLPVSGVTGNTQSTESNKRRDHRVVSAGTARYLVLRHDDDGIAGRICVNESGRGGQSEMVPGVDTRTRRGRMRGDVALSRFSENRCRLFQQRPAAPSATDRHSCGWQTAR